MTPPTLKANNYNIIPSILSADFGKFIDEIKTVDIPDIDTLHVDVMDGHFVPNLTFGPDLVKSLKKNTRFFLDVHLMIENVAESIPKFAQAGADIITIHQEATRHLHRHLHRIKELGKRAGVSLNPATPLENIQYVLKDVDLVLIMSVNPGFGGQQFIPSSIEKIKKLRQIKQDINAEFVIEVDGGIDANTAGKVYLAGARYLVAGNAIFGQKDRPAAIQKIQKSLQQADSQKRSQLV